MSAAMHQKRTVRARWEAVCVCVRPPRGKTSRYKSAFSRETHHAHPPSRTAHRGTTTAPDKRGQVLRKGRAACARNSRQRSRARAGERGEALAMARGAHVRPRMRVRSRARLRASRLNARSRSRACECDKQRRKKPLPPRHGGAGGRVPKRLNPEAFHCPNGSGWHACCVTHCCSWQPRRLRVTGTCASLSSEIRQLEQRATLTPMAHRTI